MDVFTVGYGGRDREGLIALLKTHHIQTVVDVRLRPDRASMGIWVRAGTPDKGIEKWLSDAGIGYRSLVELGNVFLECDDWLERFRRLMESSGELLIDRLMTIPGPVCLLCAERRVAECHRSVIAEYLARYKAARVHHLE